MIFLHLVLHNLYCGSTFFNPYFRLFRQKMQKILWIYKKNAYKFAYLKKN